MEAPIVSANEGEKTFPNLDLAQLIYEYENGALDKKGAVLDIVKENNMADTYTQVCAQFNWEFDQSLEEAMTKTNEETLAKLEAAEVEAAENAGDMEVQDARLAKARHFSQTGQWELAVTAYKALINGKKVSGGKKIDATFEIIRIALWNNDTAKLKSAIADAKVLVEAGGDWDRRNRLKTYEALYLIMSRDIRGASTLLLECVATFTATELFSYERFMFYAMITAIMALSRTQMRTKVVKNPQVGGILSEVEGVEPLVMSLYECEYMSFFKHMVNVHPLILKDRYLGPHTSYILREYRIVAYKQFLEAYKSVLLSSMAASFGITVDMMDAELARFIASGRLSAKIDKVGDVVETVRPEKKSAQFQDTIKKGDVLLANIQKLARALDV